MKRSHDNFDPFKNTILEAILERMVGAQKEIEATLSSSSDKIQMLKDKFHGWQLNVVVESSNFIATTVKAEKGSKTAFRKNGFSHLCFFKINKKPCEIKIVECMDKTCSGQQDITKCKKEKDLSIIEICITDSKDKIHGKVYKNDVIHIGPNCCYAVEVLEDSEFLLCMISSDV